MARGRKFVPATTSDGTWFCHRGAASAGGNRVEATSTGMMLSAPFNPIVADTKPLPPPPMFRSKTEVNYKTSNRFSQHDNRHAFQDHGVYFGDGKDERSLGRKVILPDLRLHHTENEFLKHHGKTVVDRDLHTTYGNSYLGQPTNHQPVHRRFAKVYKQPASGQIKLDTTTTDQYQNPDIPYRTPTHVLAISQEPFLKHNAWKYSNHGLRKIYPPYDRRNEPIVKNEFNKYGAAFTV